MLFWFRYGWGKTHLVFRVYSKPLKREDFHCEKKVVLLVGASRLKQLWKSQPVVQDCHHCPPPPEDLCCHFNHQKSFTLGLWKSSIHWRALTLPLPSHTFIPPLLQSLAKPELCLAMLPWWGWGLVKLLWYCVLVVLRGEKEKWFRLIERHVLILRSCSLDLWRCTASPASHKSMLMCSFCPLIHKSLQ